MAPSATSTEIDHINHLVLTEKDINVEHNIDDHVAFGTDKVLQSRPSLFSPANTHDQAATTNGSTTRKPSVSTSRVAASARSLWTPTMASATTAVS